MSNQRVLLLTLRTKRNKRVIAEAIKENFGQCPSEKWFDDLLEKTGADDIELTALQIAIYSQTEGL